MADGGEEQGLTYSAFISYSHVDQAFAKRLHRRLEAYRLPRNVTRLSEVAGSGRRLLPVFRDRDELRASSDLTGAVRDAITRSAFLIVVCSEASVKSDWVGREIALFRSVRGDDRILVALVDGASEACFHPSLVGAEPGGVARVPLAAAFGREGDGDRLALLKLIAVMADVRLDQLVQRDAQRRMRVVAAAGGAAAAGLAVVALLSLAALHAREEADNSCARGDKLIEYQLTKVRDQLKAAGTLALLKAVNDGASAYYDAQDLSRLCTGNLELRAKLLQAEGEDDEKRGLLDQARVEFDEALRTTTALLDKKPGDEDAIYAQAQSEYWVGDIDWRTGDHAGTERAWLAYKELALRLLQISPGKPEWLRELAYADTNLGMFALRHKGDTAAAEVYFRDGLSKRRLAAQSQPKDMALLDDIGDSYAWLGENSRAASQFHDALNWFAVEREVRDRLLEPNDRNADYRAEIVSNLLAVARIKSEQGHFDEAKRKLDQAHERAMQLWQGDQQNLSNYKKMRALDLFEARNWMMMPQAEQPKGATIPDAIGDCKVDGPRGIGDELAMFCIVLAARYATLTGDDKSARRLLRSVMANVPSSADRFSAVWQLDFADEIGRVQDILRGRIK